MKMPWCVLHTQPRCAKNVHRQLLVPNGLAGLQSPAFQETISSDNIHNNKKKNKFVFINMK